MCNENCLSFIRAFDSLFPYPSRRLLSCPLWTPSCRTLKFPSLRWWKKTSARSWTASRNTFWGRSTWIRRSYVTPLCNVLGYSKKKEGFIIKANKLLLYSLSQKNFYGPQVRWMCLSMFLRIGVWRNIWRAYRRGFWGNLRGEGLVLGGVFVIGPGDQVEHKWCLKKYLIPSVSGYFHWLWLIIFLLPGYSTGAPGEGIWG